MKRILVGIAAVSGFVLITLFGSSGLSTGLSAAPSSPVTELLSDHDATEGGMQILPNLDLTAAGPAAYVLWTEDTGTLDGHGFFYQRLPAGTTGQIPGHFVEFFHSTSIHGASAADGSARFIWREDMGTPEGFNLFLWDSADGSVTELSDSLNQGNIGSSQIDVDDGGYAQVVWEEDTASYEEVFFWDQADGTTRMLSDPGLPGGAIFGAPLMVLEGGATHVAWSEYTDDVGFDLFYWDSASDLVRDLSPAGDAGAPAGERLLVDPAGEADLFWLEDLASSFNCPLHWNSISVTVESLAGVDGGCSAAEIGAALDGLGNSHAAWRAEYQASGQDALFYWSSGIATTTVVATGTTDAALSLQATENGTAHIAWTTDYAYHWDSGSGQVVSISPAPPTEGFAGQLQSSRDDNNQVHIIWQERADSVEQLDVYYWNSGSGVTHRLSDPPVVSGNAQQMILRVGADNVAHVLWEEQSETSGQWALFYWNSASQTLEELGDTTTGEDDFLMILDAGDEANVVWVSESGTGEGQDLWFWTEADGPVNLSDLGATEGDVANDSLGLVRDDGGRVYAVWVEESGTAEGADLFGAWAVEEPTEDLYLPFLVH